MHSEYVEATLFNLIPNKIKTIVTFETFQLTLRQYLVVQPYYKAILTIYCIEERDEPITCSAK